MAKSKQKNNGDLFGLGDGYKLIFEKMTDAVALHKIVLNKDGKPVDYIFVKVNPAFEVETGLKAKNIIGERVTKVIPGIKKDPADWIGRYGKVAKGGKERRFEQHSEALAKTYDILAYSPQRGYFITVFSDISKQVKIQKDLSESEEGFRELMEQSPFAIQVMDTKGKILLVNDAYARLWGESRSTLKVVHAKYNILKDDQLIKLGLMSYVKKGFAGKNITLPPFEYEPKKTKDARLIGRKRWIQSFLYSVKDHHGKIKNVVMVHEDITERREYEKNLELYKKIIENSSNEIALADTKGVIIYVNASWAKNHGYKKENLVGRSLGICHPKSEFKKIEKFNKKLLKQGKYQGEIVHKRKNGKEYTALMNNFIVYSEGEVSLMIAMATDITEKKESEESLKKSEEKFNVLANNVSDGIFMHKNGTFLEVNETLAKMMGYKVKEMIGASISQFVTPESLVEGQKNKTKVGVSEEYVAVRKNGTTFSMEVVANNIEYKGENVRIVTVRDIDERKQAEESLKIKNFIFDHSFGANSIADTKGNITEVNQSFLNIWGFSNKKEVLGKSIASFFDNPKDAVSVLSKLNKEGQWMGDYVGKRKNGSTFIAYGPATSLVDEKGDVIGYQSSVFDVTKERLSERILLEEKAKSSLYLEIAPVIIIALDFQGKVTLINKKGSEMLGYKDQDLIGLDWFSCCLPSGQIKPVKDVFRKLMKGEAKFAEHYENLIITKQGKEKLISWSNTILKDEKGKTSGILSSGVDITEKNKVKVALKESEERFRDVALSSSDWLWEINAQGQYTFVSEGVKKVLGYEPKALIGKTPFDYMLKKEAQRIRAVFQQFILGKEKIVDLENWNRHKDGRKVLLLTSGVPVLDKNGKLEGYRGVDKDITEVHAARVKLKKHTEELERMNKLMIGREKKMAELKKEINIQR